MESIQSSSDLVTHQFNALFISYIYVVGISHQRVLGLIHTCNTAIRCFLWSFISSCDKYSCWSMIFWIAFDSSTRLEYKVQIYGVIKLACRETLNELMEWMFNCVCYMCVICVLYVCYMCVLYMLYVCYMYVICLLYACYMFVICVLYVCIIMNKELYLICNTCTLCHTAHLACSTL